MKGKKFIRNDSYQFSKLGKNRKKLQKWRQAKGKHSKVRRKRAGYPRFPVVGFKRDNSIRGKIENRVPVLVNNFAELEKVDKKNIVILSRRIGMKKKMEMIKKAKEMGLKILNVEEQNGSR